MRRLLSSMSVTAVAVLLSASLVAAQEECQGCRNDPDTQVCTDWEHSQTIIPWNECRIYQGFCQLEGFCELEEEEAALLYASPDRMVTAAGTYRPPRSPRVLGTRSGSVISCGGFVVVPADRPSERPARIILESD